MLSDSNIIYIFKILLNKDLNPRETPAYKNFNLEDLKKHIYNSKEFKDFRNIHLEKIRVLVEEEIAFQYSGINFEKFWKELIKLNYDLEKFRLYIRNLSDNLRKQYKDFYKKYLLIDKEISGEEIAVIIRSSCSVEFYISTSDFFLEKCDIVIENLLDQM
jgi:hypothetical protein